MKDIKYKHNLAVTAIIRNEAVNLAEWIDYHIAAGVDKFYIFDDNSEDNTYEVLQPYINQGIVDYRELGYQPYHDYYNIQIIVYNFSLELHRYDTEYMAFIDVDEFILPYVETDIYTATKSILSQSDYAGGLAVHWRIFGSSGHVARPESVLSSYCYRAEDNFPNNTAVKSIVNPRKVLGWYRQPHGCYYVPGYYAIDENGERLDGSNGSNVTANKIRINHYFCKSREDWEMKMKRGLPDCPRNQRPRKESVFDERDRNEIYDDDILKYILDMYNQKKGRLGRKMVNNNYVIVPSEATMFHSLAILLKYDSSILSRLYTQTSHI